jgi:hypothetical protein
MVLSVTKPHAYVRDANSGAGNCWCGWPDLWGNYPPPIHGGPSWAERRVMWRAEPKLSGLERARWAIAEARGDHGTVRRPILWELGGPKDG